MSTVQEVVGPLEATRNAYHMSLSGLLLLLWKIFVFSLVESGIDLYVSSIFFSTSCYLYFLFMCLLISLNNLCQTSFEIDCGKSVLCDIDSKSCCAVKLNVQGFVYLV